MDDTKTKAFIEHMDAEDDEAFADECSWNEDIVTFECAEWLVLTDGEAEYAWEEALENYLDDCVLPEISSEWVRYFDSEAWKHDARLDGRGHSLAHYDGEEHGVNIDGEWIYLYRIN